VIGCVSAGSVCEVLGGLINPLADQPKINVGLLCMGSGMTTMIAIVFAIGLALLLAYFVK
jgi:ABC-type phosphate transport system permease subunit